MMSFATGVLASHGTAIFSVGQAGYIIKSESGQLLAIDLYLSDCLERVFRDGSFKRLLPKILRGGEIPFDVVICTHPHLDHFDVDAMPEIMQPGGALFCSVDCQNLIEETHTDQYAKDITYVRPGEHHDAGDFGLTFVNCDHGTQAPDAVGVIVEVDEKMIYIAGDTCLRLDRVDEVPRPLDVLIAPINGAFGNMDEADCVALALALEPRVTIPSHYGMCPAHHGDIGRFYEIATEKGVPFHIMRQGERFSIESISMEFQ